MAVPTGATIGGEVAEDGSERTGIPAASSDAGRAETTSDASEPVDAATTGEADDVRAAVGPIDLGSNGDAQRRFRSFFAETEPRLRRALVAAYGTDLGSEAAADALAWAWENFEQVEGMESSLGYLWRVGQTSVRRRTRRWRRESPWRQGAVPTEADDDAPVRIEPALVDAIGRLSERQRVAVLLVHAYGYRLTEVAELQGCSVSTVRNHLRRGLSRLRAALGVEPTPEVDHG